MHGLSVRWSLAGTPDPDDLAARLREYVQGTSLQRFAGMPGLRFKVWRMRAGEEFEGVYVFATPDARAQFADSFRAGAADSPGSKLVGSAPVAIEPFEVVAIAEGADGFTAGPGPDTA